MTNERLCKTLLLLSKTGEDCDHARQVARLSLSLFDGTASLHGLGAASRELLEIAALLHDIGRIHGNSKHHKKSRNLILADATIPFDHREDRMIAAAVARYHRRALPDTGHLIFGVLGTRGRERVSKMAAIVRVADGMDRSHLGLAKAIRVEEEPFRVRIKVSSFESSPMDRDAGMSKADLFEKAYRKKLVIDWPDSAAVPEQGR